MPCLTLRTCSAPIARALIGKSKGETPTTVFRIVQLSQVQNISDLPGVLFSQTEHRPGARSPAPSGKPLKKQKQISPAGPILKAVRPLPHASWPSFENAKNRALENRKIAGSRLTRHACGYKLANDGHDTRSLQAYLGHRNIQNTTRYTALAPDRFKGFWKD